MIKVGLPRWLKELGAEIMKVLQMQQARERV